MYEYIVRPGDTINKIADCYGVSAEFLMAANPVLRSEQLFVGQRLLIPIGRYLDEVDFTSQFWQGSGQCP